jgi:hypothetical protein
MDSNREQRFSGHESFVCRYGWLSKLYNVLKDDPLVFTNEERTIVKLGIGKNMVRSIRFWGESFGLIAADAGNRYRPTPLATALLEQNKGRDPFLEDHASLWLLHWKLTVSARLGAWHAAFIDVQDHEILKQRFTDIVRLRAVRAKGTLAESTLRQHVAIFLNTYVSPNLESFTVPEESLGCPLQELGLIQELPDGGKDEILLFNRGPKHGLTGEVFLHALFDFWAETAPDSKTLSLKEVCFGHMSPGMVFKLDENSIQSYLNEIEKLSGGVVTFVDTADSQALNLQSRFCLSDIKTQLGLT